MPAIKRLLIVYSFIHMATSGFAQLKEGSLIYSIKYEDATLDSSALKGLPDSSSIYFKNDKIRIDMQIGKGAYNIVIADNLLKQVHVLMNMKGTKTDMLLSEKDILKKMDKNPQVTILKDSTRMIAGFNCIKAIVTTNGYKMEVWFTPDISILNLNWNNALRNIDGFPMEYTLLTGNLHLRMTAKEVKPGPIDDNIFLVPEDYVKVDREKDGR
jgi:hypothetical protein